MSAQESVVATGAPPKSRSRLPLILSLLVLVGGAAAGGAWYAGLLPGSQPAAEESGAGRPDRRAPIYHTLDSGLVVNFRNDGRARARYLQVGIEVMSRDPGAIAALQTHNAVIRNNLIMLFSDKSFEELSSREGKENLQREALAEVQRVMQLHHGSPAVESLYFTGFLMQ